MIYLLGGPPRTGKSTLARRLNQHHGLPVVSTDLLRGVLITVVPELRAAMQGGDPYQEAEVLYPFLRQTIAVANVQLSDCVVEGVGFFPTHVTRLRSELGMPVRCCLLGRSTASPEDLFGYESQHRVYDKLSAEQKEAFGRMVVGWTHRLAADCEEHGAPFTDLAQGPFADSMQTAETMLLGAAAGQPDPRESRHPID
jgi:hypothetical protein